ncbi:WD40 repeat domain-containing protein, partial [Planctomycetota bacterium]
LEGHGSNICAVALSDDARLGLAADERGTLRLWDFGRLRHNCVRRPVLAPPRTVRQSLADEQLSQQHLEAARQALAADDTHTALQALDRVRELPGYERAASVRTLLRDLTARLQRATLRGSWDSVIAEGQRPAPNSVALSADGHLALTGGDDGVIRLWDVAAGACLRTLTGHKAAAYGVALSANGRIGLSGGADRTLKVWKVMEGTCTRTLEGHEGVVHSVALSGNARFGLSGGADWTVRLWDLSQGTCLSTLTGHSRNVEFVALSADGQVGLSGGADRVLRVWDLARARQHGTAPSRGLRDSIFSIGRLAKGFCRHSLKGHEDRISSGALSANGRFAVSGSRDRTLRLWDLETGGGLLTQTDRNAEVGPVALSADGRHALAGSVDGTLRLWDLTSGTCLRMLRGHKKRTTAVALSPEGCLGLSASQDGTLRLWEFDWDLAPRDRALDLAKAYGNETT